LIKYFFPQSDSDGPQSRLFDVGSLVLAASLFVVLSFEGHPRYYSFANANQSTARVQINESDEKVWKTMQTATSPDFPLPTLLKSLPIPTEVTIDQGTVLGALRKVEFKGREGQGHLTLKVLEHTPTRAVFHVLEDTSPFSQWLTLKSIAYVVTPDQNGTQLDVTLEFERGLAPKWFFAPVMKTVGYYAMDVLARDVKTRPEL